MAKGSQNNRFSKTKCSKSNSSFTSDAQLNRSTKGTVAIDLNVEDRMHCCPIEGGGEFRTKDS